MHLIHGGEQNVPARQVAVYEALGLEVRHAAGDLDAVLDERRDEEAVTLLTQAVQQRTERSQLRHLSIIHARACCSYMILCLYVGISPIVYKNERHL